jgi:thymidylate synthase
MQQIYARNVSEALWIGVQALESKGRWIQTRNGRALEFETPVCTTFTNSRERVLFYPLRDANPFFHLFESLWMLHGSNDVEWISEFNGRISQYSDDGVTFHGAYGYRWRHWFGYDQLERALERLITYPNDRRTVVSMWDPAADLVTDNTQRDLPCNTQIFFGIREGLLDMTIVNRSNDMIWGAYGANAVHMSVLLEYMAARLELGVGTYYLFSNNLHIYEDIFKKIKGIIWHAEVDPYLTIGKNKLSYNPPPLVDDHTTFDTELTTWINDHHLREDNEYYRTPFNNSFFEKTATPMRIAWSLWKNKKVKKAINCAQTIEDLAWRKACVEWLTRRKEGGNDDRK